MTETKLTLSSLEPGLRGAVEAAQEKKAGDILVLDLTRDLIETVVPTGDCGGPMEVMAATESKVARMVSPSPSTRTSSRCAR